VDHARSYENVFVDFIPHHNPDLVLKDKNDKEVARLNLEEYNDVKALHRLFVQFGFKKEPTPDEERYNML
jgi:hypothetical protein